MTAQQNHSPINFTIAEGVYADQIYIKDALGKIVCDFANRENGKANSTFVLLACNSFYENKRIIKNLLEACKVASDNLSCEENDVAWQIVQAAITKAEKGAS